MAEDILLIREGHKLGAADPISAECIESMAHGEMVVATVRRARNAGHHRKLFALLKAVFENQSRHPTMTDLLSAVKIGTGLFTTGHVYVRGVPVQVCIPKSISFAAMGQKRFEEWFDAAVQFVIQDILPGLDKADLEQRVLDILGDGAAKLPESAAV